MSAALIADSVGIVGVSAGIQYAVAVYLWRRRSRRGGE